MDWSGLSACLLIWECHGALDGFDRLGSENRWDILADWTVQPFALVLVDASGLLRLTSRAGESEHACIHINIKIESRRVRRCRAVHDSGHHRSPP